MNPRLPLATPCLSVALLACATTMPERVASAVPTTSVAAPAASVPTPTPPSIAEPQASEEPATPVDAPSSGAAVVVPKDAPPCARVVDHAKPIVQAEARARLAGKLRGREDQKWLDSFVAGEVRRLRDFCERRPWSVALRKCILAARTNRDLRACDEAEVERSPDHERCAFAASHRKRLLATEAAKDGSGSAFDQVASSLEALDAKGCVLGWSAKQRECVIAARSIAEDRICWQ